MEITLSILIATFSRDAEKLKVLLSEINNQMQEGIEIIINSEEKTIIGKKRNDLLKQAKGKYIVFIDSDDHISNNYIWSIMQACSIGNDCIGISGTITTNGKNARQWHISKEYGKWYQISTVYYRTPNHISPVKRELALKAGFPEITFGEDAEYSRRLLPLLKSETIIKGNIYHYDYWQQKSNR
jgi:glycosyltransferase involved in cell wall biosynthesis